jgi:hypothetical protein
MPRKAAASLSIIPRVPGRGRPQPPSDLDPIEQRIWGEVLDALPDHWIDSAGCLILRRLVAQAAVCERQEARLREFRAQEDDASEESVDLTAQHGITAKNVAFLLDQLRATPKSRLRPPVAGSKVERHASDWRPWEIRDGQPAQTDTEQ